MKITSIKTAPIPPFMGGKNLCKYQQKSNDLEYIKKWRVKNDATK